MQKYFEKIKERLEVEVEYQSSKADKAGETCAFEEITVVKAREKMAECYEHAIEIVNQVAEEYGKDANVPSNDGWIPCSNNQEPKEGKFYNVTIFDGEDYRTEPAYYARIGYLGQRNIKARWWTDCTSYAELIEEDDDKVIAWQPLPAPYQPKGEQ